MPREHYFENKPTAEEVGDLVQWAHEGMDEGSHYHGMSYEQGIMATLNWLEGNGPRPDLDEE